MTAFSLAMKPEIKKQWVDALRSGKYKQTRGALRRDHHGTPGYCCIGVLCEVTKQGEWSQSGKSDRLQGIYGYSTQATDDEICNWEGRGFTEDGKDVGEGELGRILRDRFKLDSDIESTLIGMNDEQSESFNTIAAFIEANL
jgi:hypothetical protein